jgi:2-methylcitrate dehydratase PrpD
MNGWRDIRKSEAELAEFASGLRWDAVPDDVRVRARLVALDTIAHMLMGSREEPARTLLATYPIGGRGRATVIGTRRRATPAVAGFLNGFTTTITQFDEGHLFSRGHPAINAMPAVLAVAEEHGASGRDALLAFVVGYEVAARVGMAVGPLKAGLHPHGMSGVLGAAAAAGKLLQLKPLQFRHLLNAAATLTLVSQDDTSYAGATIHHALIGAGVGNAIHAAFGVAAGLTGAEGGLSEFYLSAAGQAPDPSLLNAGLGTTFEIRRSFFKIYPACGHVGSPVEALRAMMATAPLDCADIETIRIFTYGSASLLGDDRPANALAGKFSIPYSIAAYLRTGRLDLDSYGSGALSDPDIQRLATRVQLKADPTLSPPFPHGRPCRVEVVLRDGSVRTGSTEIPLGNHGNPAPDADIIAKADRLVSRASGRRQAERVRSVVLGMDDLGSIRQLTRLLA